MENTAKKMTMFYVYILSLHETGQYYVGVTKTPDKRRVSHHNHIRDIVVRKKDHDFWAAFSRKKVKDEYIPNRGHKVHWVFALNILPKVNHFVSPDKTIADFYSFRVVHSCLLIEEAITIENMYLDIAKRDRLCLNTQSVSCYK